MGERKGGKGEMSEGGRKKRGGKVGGKEGGREEEEEREERGEK